jgi:dipeptidyl aminopeptidase/acylaminoacyl peptidase
MKYPIGIAALFVSMLSFAQKNASVSFEKWISLKSVGSPVISPDGRTVIYSVNNTDWLNNSYDSELWMSRDGAPALQLTRTNKGSSVAGRFSPDSRFVSFLADRGDKTQLFIISVNGGEALQVTKDEDGVGAYEWNPDGSKIAYVKADAETKKDKTIKDRFGAFGVEGEEYRQNHLWLLNFNYDSVVMAGQVPCYDSKKDSTKKDTVQNPKGQDCFPLPVAKKLTQGNFNVGRFLWNPDGKSIAFVRQPDPLINSSTHAGIYQVETASKNVSLLVDKPSADFIAAWSPDGKSFLYATDGTDSVSNYYKNSRYFIYDVANKNEREVLQSVDENKNIIDWNANGIYFTALQKMKQAAYALDPQSNKINPLSLGLDLVGTVALSKNTSRVAISGRNYADLNEIFVGKLDSTFVKLTNSSGQVAEWNTPVNEIIEWKSQDGTVIQGVLLKPKNYDPARKYPLLVVIHGGPTGIDLPDPTPTYVYPIMQWVEKGALVLRVNYRGSAGYGEKFRSLNVRNLGIGDMWDVLSGVDYLNKKKMIDTSRMGCMGWSQGGYISAFLTTNTHIFKAISVGAGISNWVTYYVNTDITPFTRQYLQSTPWNDMDVYLKTSPMTNINKASTPTLIQHGELDKRVPIANAYELYRGLQDRRIPSRLIVYKGFGHGINKPKERLAAVWHNWQWFNKYVFGEEDNSMPVE